MKNDIVGVETEKSELASLAAKAFVSVALFAIVIAAYALTDIAAL